jgi:hypothetical protein
MNRNSRLFAILGALLVAAVLVVPVALGATPNDVQYNKAALQPPKVAGASSPLGSPSSGTLPFTGLDLGLVGGAGVLLIAGGFAFRRLGRKGSQPGS